MWQAVNYCIKIQTRNICNRLIHFTLLNILSFIKNLVIHAIILKFFHRPIDALNLIISRAFIFYLIINWWIKGFIRLMIYRKSSSFNYRLVQFHIRSQSILKSQEINFRVFKRLFWIFASFNGYFEGFASFNGCFWISLIILHQLNLIFASFFASPVPFQIIWRHEIACLILQFGDFSDMMTLMYFCDRTFTYV